MGDIMGNITTLAAFNSESRFLEQALNDGITLLVEAKNYMTYQEKRERESCNLSTGLRIGYQQTRITARVMHGLAWLLGHKAIAAGEITADQLQDAEWTLGGADECTSLSGHDSDVLPKGLRELLDRSHAFYSRVQRLEAMMKISHAQKPAIAKVEVAGFTGLYLISSDAQQDQALRA